VSRRNFDGCSCGGGARTPACSVHTHVNAKPGVSTRPRITLDRRNDASANRVSLDIPRNAIPLVAVSDPMIVRLPLPKRLANAIESLVGLPRSCSFQRLQELSRRNKWQQQHVNVIRHDDKGPQLIVPQLGTLKQRINDDLCNGLLPQERWTGPSLIEISVDPAERLSRCRFRRWREFTRRQAAVKRPRYEQPLAFGIAVRQPPPGVHIASSVQPSPKISRSHECERGTHECVRHECL